jgi:hypothetical protein
MKTFHCRFLDEPTGTIGKSVRGMYSSLLIVLSLMLLLFQFSTPVVIAQTTTSTIEGTVTDANGAVIAGATVKASGTTLATERSVTTDDVGFYRITALPAGTYTVTISQTGFSTNTSNIELTVNRVARFDIQMQVGNVVGDVNVTDELPLLEPEASSTGATVTPRQIQDLPVNGREYLDLLQLVPGVAINRQSTGDNANPVLGERSGNNNFFIDGQPNKNTVTGGPAAPFNQETIAEFQVLTTGYKAEFGQASGAIVNVITKSGGNAFHGVGSLFVRNEALDASNSLEPFPVSSAQVVTEPPHLRRFDYSLAGGGPIWRDRVFFFASAERITEDRGVDFAYPPLPPVLNNLIHAQEDPFNVPTRFRETRAFVKLNQNFGRHQLTQEMNYTNEFTRRAGSGLPTTRTDSGARFLLLGASDTMLLGDQGNPWILTLRGAYRGEPSDSGPSNPEIIGATTLNAFSVPRLCPPTCNATNLFGDLPGVQFGNATTYSLLDQQYTSLAANANKRIGDHDLKFGWQFLKTKVDGTDPVLVTNQIFSTVNDYVNLGPINSGIFLLLERGAPTPERGEIHLDNNYNALYVQDDWKFFRNLTFNLGLRWEHDSEFTSKKNFAPRFGFAWAVDRKTVVRGQYGRFYDQFRLGLVSGVPAFGGAERGILQFLYFPRGLYGSPSYVASLARAVGLPGFCASNHLTDAQITTGGVVCPTGGGPIIGVDRLNNVVAPGHAPIPANAVINISNIQALTGLTPDQYLAQAAAAVGQPNGYFVWGRFGVLNNRIIPESASPTAVAATFKTPHTLGFSIGLQREITNDMVIEVDYHHRKMKNLLGIRLSNLAFISRVVGRRLDPPGPELPTFGPFFEGKYDALVVSVNKRLSNRYQIGASYTWSNATDNSLGINTNPTDQFIGLVPEVTDPGRAATPTTPACPSQNNLNGSFVACNGNFVAAAGTFLNGPDLDKGPSALALDHIFQVNGLLDLPWKFQVSGIFRVQSGFHFSRFDELSRDPDGNGNFNSIDFTAGRNAFTAPPFVNLDMRFSKRFNIGERVSVQLLLEFFNVFNRQNPATVQNRADSPLRPNLRPFGTANQVLPGREGQFGIRLSF